MSKYAPIHTLDYRLAMLGFSHPSSIEKKTYHNSDGDSLKKVPFGWVLTKKGIETYSCSKRLIVEIMENLQNKKEETK